MILTKINLNNIRFTNKKKTIFHIPNVKLKISLFLYDYQNSILNNRLDLFKDNDYLDLNNLNDSLLIEAEKLENKDLIKYLYTYKFKKESILIPDEWYELYFQSKLNINLQEWEIYKLFSVINNQIVDRPGDNNEKWFDVAVRYIGMGIFCVMSILKKENKCFFRISGGSTGYDYKGYRDSFINFDPYSNEDKMFDIKEGIQLMEITPSDLYNIIQKGDYQHPNFIY